MKVGKWNGTCRGGPPWTSYPEGNARFACCYSSCSSTSLAVATGIARGSYISTSCIVGRCRAGKTHVRGDTEPHPRIYDVHLREAFVGLPPPNHRIGTRGCHQEIIVIGSNECSEERSCGKERGSRRLRPAFERKGSPAALALLAEHEMVDRLSSKAGMEGFERESTLADIACTEPNVLVWAKRGGYDRGLAHRDRLSALPHDAVCKGLVMNRHGQLQSD